MNTQTKTDIQWRLKTFVASHPSQKQASQVLGVSEATVINLINEKWDSISDEMFMKIKNAMESRVITTPVAYTTAFDTLVLYFDTAKQEGASFAITGHAGAGKSFAGKWYAQTMREKNVFYVECAEYWSKKMFLSKILQAMGRSSNGSNVGDMMYEIVNELRRKKQPLIILDEIDKLSDPCLKFFITLYNELNGACGFVWTSTDNIKKRVDKGLRNNKNGYQELFSRIGQRFIELVVANLQDVRLVCESAGITEEEDVRSIFNEADGDMRRVERSLLRKKMKSIRRSQKAAA